MAERENGRRGATSLVVVAMSAGSAARDRWGKRREGGEEKRPAGMAGGAGLGQQVAVEKGEGVPATGY